MGYSSFNHKRKAPDPAEMYLLNAFSISIEDDIQDSSKMFRSIWAAINQKTIKDMPTAELKKIKEQLTAIESKPSSKIPVNIYDLCQVYKMSRGKSVRTIRIRSQSTHKSVRVSPADVEDELRAVMDRLNVICGKLIVYTGTELRLPSQLRQKGVSSGGDQETP